MLILHTHLHKGKDMKKKSILNNEIIKGIRWLQSYGPEKWERKFDQISASCQNTDSVLRCCVHRCNCHSKQRLITYQTPLLWGSVLTAAILRIRSWLTCEHTHRPYIISRCCSKRCSHLDAESRDRQCAPAAVSSGHLLSIILLYNVRIGHVWCEEVFNKSLLVQYTI